MESRVIINQDRLTVNWSSEASSNGATRYQIRMWQEPRELIDDFMLNLTVSSKGVVSDVSLKVGLNEMVAPPNKESTIFDYINQDMLDPENPGLTGGEHLLFIGPPTANRYQAMVIELGAYGILNRPMMQALKDPMLLIRSLEPEKYKQQAFASNITVDAVAIERNGGYNDHAAALAILKRMRPDVPREL